MTKVVKRNGSREDFSEEKVRKALRKAVIDSGLSADRRDEAIESTTRAVAERARAREEITSREIREGILSELDRTAPDVSTSWRVFDRKYKAHYTQKRK